MAAHVSNRITDAADKMRRSDHSHYTKSVDAIVNACDAAYADGCMAFCITRTQSLHPQAVAELRQNFDVIVDAHNGMYVYDCTLRRVKSV